MAHDNTVVMVHGLLGSLAYFEPNKRLPDIEIHTPDLWGYGDIALKDALSLQDQVDFLKQFVEQNLAGPFWLLGHSVGGAIVNLFAAQYPHQVKGIINVEGNFSLRDAFWSQSIAKQPFDQWQLEYDVLAGDPEQWLVSADITPTSERIEWAASILSYQQAATVQAVARAVVKETDGQAYTDTVNHVFGSQIPVYLVAGEYSEKQWHVPDIATTLAAQRYAVKEAGHMMMLEQPDAFCQLIEAIICGKISE